MRRVPVLAILLGFTVLTVLIGHGCGEAREESGPPAIQPQGPGQPDPEAGNPDRGRWIDLAKHPFRPEWVGGTFLLSRSIPLSLNNLFVQGEGDAVSRYFLYPRLLMEDPDLGDDPRGVFPWAAAAMPAPGADDRTWNWTLRDDLTWEDGTPVTARDYAFTWQLLSDPAIRAANRRGEFSALESVEATGDYELRVRFKEPYYDAVRAFGLGFTVVPAHAVPAEPEAYNALDRHLAFGPYRIAAYGPDELQLELRPEYRERPFPVLPWYIERFHYVRAAQDASLLQLLSKGETDLAVVSHEQYPTVDAEPSFAERCWKTFFYMPLYQSIQWNLRDPADPGHVRPHPVLGDVRVRRALSHLIPRERIAREYFHGLCRPVSGPLFFKEQDYDQEIAPDAFDPGEARRLLAEAGWKLNSQGVLEKQGQPLRITVLRVPGVDWMQAPTTLLQEEARKIGAIVEIQDLPYKSFVSQIQEHRFDAAVFASRLQPASDFDQYPSWHSSQATENGGNYGGLADERVDANLEAHRAAADPRERLRLRRELHALLAELQPAAFLWSQPSAVAIARRWANVRIHDLGLRFWDFVLREKLEAHPPEGR